MSTRLLVLAALLAPGVAAAEHRMVADGAAEPLDFIATRPNQDDLVFARQLVAPGPGGGTSSALAQSRIIYLNRTGVTLRPGANDARMNTSSVVGAQTVAIPAWDTDATTWSTTVACVRELFAPFDVTVVETDPGNVPHMEGVFGGSPQQVGLAANVGGVSPFASDCSVLESSIVFTFTENLPNDARLACEIMAQEIAHSYGLDHELLDSDPMTYLAYDGNRSFKNTLAACGEDAERPCGINGTTCRVKQNSVLLLNERLGARSGDITAPTAGISSPKNNATVPPGFTIHATATDNVRVASARMYIDDAPSGSAVEGAGPFTFTTPGALAEGPHAIAIEVTDGQNTQRTVISVIVQAGAPGDYSHDLVGGCSTGGGGSATWFGLLGLLGLARRRR
ncbi:MAG: Ig-like domain-containing protein [Deltaproteobacteria bacterium]|nr:Ig-like domain-containing protein [Deltaproteobacteria bacterium]